MNRRAANCPFEAAIAGPVLRLADLELQRLVHEAESRHVMSGRGELGTP
jgi:hypothetical protein